MRWLEHQWSEAFFLAFFHASEPLIEWISQLLVKTQQLGRATDKAAVFAFIYKLVLKKKKKREREGKERKLIPVIWVDILKSNAGHCSAGMLGGLGREGRSREKQVNRLLNPFLSLPLSAHLFFFLFFPPPLLLLLFSDHAWWQTALIHLAQDPESAWCHRLCESLLPFHSRSFRCL